MLPRIFFEKYIYILALEMASPGNRHGANNVSAHFHSLYPLKILLKVFMWFPGHARGSG